MERETMEFMTMSEMAEFLHQPLANVKYWRATGLLPEPDAKIGRAVGWSAESALKFAHDKGIAA
jgi:hypothetical protein